MRVVFHSGGVFILLGWLGVRGNQYCPIGQRAGRDGKKGKKGQEAAGREGWAGIFSCAGCGKWIF